MKNKCLVKKKTQNNKEGLKIAIIRVRPLDKDDVLEISLMTEEVNN